ncbi:MAG: hypothetical protein MPK09_07810 [Gammaproteobacteria bacterium]|nr:hypothetical protein [Gammaproteobacteria bacterium]
MNKTEKLNNLFDRWVKEHKVPETEFFRDGIIYEPDYEKQKQKILFICKEPNAPANSAIDFREVWQDPEDKKHRFGARICQWAYGIQDGFRQPYDDCAHEFDTSAERTDILKTIAFMNLKKVAGGSEADQEKIQKAVEKDRDFIREEINIIDPDVIVFSGYPENLDTLFGENGGGLERTDSGYQAALAKVGSGKLIHFWHPSNLYQNGMMYAHLKCIYESEAFKNL